MDTVIIVAVIAVATVAWLAWLWSTVASDGFRSRRAPQHAQWHWSSGTDALPDSPYRTLDRVA